MKELVSNLASHIARAFTFSEPNISQVLPEVRAARQAQAREFLGMLMNRAEQGETIGLRRLRELSAEWQEAHRGEEGGYNLTLGWVSAEAGSMLDEQDLSLVNRTWNANNREILHNALKGFRWEYSTSVDLYDPACKLTERGEKVVSYLDSLTEDQYPDDDLIANL